jgi:tetratricopeptide (TPR) repeat protein
MGHAWQQIGYSLASRLMAAAFGMTAIIGMPLALAQPSTGTGDPPSPTFDELWADAAALQDAHQYGAAAAAFRAILAEYPDSQRAALRIAICEENGGLVSNAIDSYQAAIDLAPYGSWTETALFFQARACHGFGCPATARDAIALLKQRFPDSAWVARVRVLEAQLDQVPTLAAEAALALELVAGQALDTAIALANTELEDQQILRLNNLIGLHPTSATALRARERVGHLLIRKGDTANAIAQFEQLLFDLQTASPEARIVQTARTRLAALYHVAGQRDDALFEFDDLAATAADPSVQSNAVLQGAGLAMELLVEQVEQVGAGSNADWEDVRDRCKQVKGLPAATPLEVARADLIVTESHYWQKQYSAALGAAMHFLAEQGELPDGGAAPPEPDGPAVGGSAPALRAEVAMAHLVAGECLQRKDLHDLALPHYRRIVDLFGDVEFMPGLTNTQRAHYRIYDALRRGSGTAAEIATAARYVLQRWPESTYADLIRADGIP